MTTTTEKKTTRKPRTTKAKKAEAPEAQETPEVQETPEAAKELPEAAKQAEIKSDEPKGDEPASLENSQVDGVEIEEPDDLVMCRVVNNLGFPVNRYGFRLDASETKNVELSMERAQDIVARIESSRSLVPLSVTILTSEEREKVVQMEKKKQEHLSNLRKATAERLNKKIK